MNGDIHPVAFYSHTFNATESNYDICDKELLAIFKAFKKWRYYLEETLVPVEVFTDHKNLVYFCESKVLSHHQARWSEFLLQFNLIIKFRPGRLEAKPDTLTCYWNIYNKRATNRAINLQPVFSQNQLVTKTLTGSPTLQAASTLDMSPLLADIKTVVASDLIYAKHLESKEDPNDPQWSVEDSGFLLHDK